MTALRRTVNSYDVFDTLLARRCVTPVGIFTEVESALHAPGFAAARHTAEHQLAAQGRPFDLHAIYTHLIATGILAPVDANRLIEAEIDAEFDNAVPITENLQQVNEGDLVVSDMYLPREIIRRLLAHVGLRCHVDIVVTNLGKHTGIIWPHISQRWLINRHLGDNPHSDIDMPGKHGIPAIHYRGAGMSPIEQQLTQGGLPALARIARTLRLSNPHSAGSQEHELWLHATQANLPLLVMFAARARRERDRLGRQHLLFSARDCYFLAEVFAALYPSESSAYIHVSREALGRSSPALREYLTNAGLEQGLVCDIAATGSSWHAFASASPSPVALFSLVFIDNWALAQVSPSTIIESPHLCMQYLLRSSEVSHYSTALEVLNTAPHGTCIDIEPGNGIPYPQLKVTCGLGAGHHVLLQQAHNASITELRRYRHEIRRELDRFDNRQLAIDLVSAISSSQLLNTLGEKLQWPKSFGPTTR